MNDCDFVYVRVADEDNPSDMIEIPSEDDGTLLISSIQAQFPQTTGLRYKNEETQSWRGIRCSDGVLYPPPEHWGNSVFYVVRPRSSSDTSSKRKINESPGQKEPEPKQVRVRDPEEVQGDLIVLGLPFAATENDMEAYFSQFGKLAFAQVKKDPATNQSRGFGFIRYEDKSSADKVLGSNHTILGRRCEVRLPRPKDDPHIPYKLFVGRLANGTTQGDLRNYFEIFGELTDVYIPKPFRAFGFVTFASSESVKRVMGSNHVVNGAQLNMTFAEPKGHSREEEANFHRMMKHFGGGFSSPRGGGSYAFPAPRSGGRFGDRSGGSYSWKSGYHDSPSQR